MFADYKTVYKNSNFMYLWISQILSQVTINIMNFILLIRIFTLTGSSLATSFLWISFALPAIFAGPIGAAMVDLMSKRKILIITNLLQAFTLFLLAIFHSQSFYLLFAAVFLYSLFNQFYVPAESAFLPSILNKKNYAKANALFFITQQGAIIVGFGMAGVLLRFVGFQNIIYFSSIMMALAFLSVSFLPEIKIREKLSRDFEENVLIFFRKIYEGYLFIKSQHKILLPFILLITLQILVSVVIINVPVLATEIVKINTNLSGAVIVIPVGIGSIIGALLLPKLLLRGIRKRRIIETSLFTMALSVFLTVFLIPELTIIYRILITSMLTILVGMSFVGIMIPAQTYLQEVTPGGMRGRVFGNFWFLVTIATILPVILSGTIVEIFGVRLLFTILAGIVFAGFVFLRRYQSV